MQVFVLIKGEPQYSADLTPRGTPMNLRLLFAVTLATVFTQTAFAQTVRVTKVSGKKAIVVRESGPPLKVGMTLNAGGGGDEFSESDMSSGGGGGSGSRDRTIGGLANLSTTSSSASTGGAKNSASAVSVTAIYGWNKKDMEYGPRFTLRRTSDKIGSAPARSSTRFGFGGFFDYNFSPNVPGKEMLYAAGATLDYFRDSASGGGSSTSTIDLFVGPALKWFPLGNSVAIRGDAGLDYARTSANGVTITAMTFLVRAGLQVYF